MGVAKRANEIVHSIGKHARLPEVLVKVIKLLSGRQVALQKQVGGFFKGGMGGEVMDGIAAVAELSRTPVNKGRGRALEIDALQSPIYAILFVTHRLRSLAFARSVRFGDRRYPVRARPSTARGVFCAKTRDQRSSTKSRCRREGHSQHHPRRANQKSARLRHVLAWA